MASLAQRIAIVTGGGSGIGQAIAVELAKYGAHVCVFDQSKKGCEDTLNMMQNDRRHLNFLGNVGTKADVDELFAYVGKEYGKPVDILVNSAGIIRDDWIWQVEEDEWDQVLRVNLKGTFLSTQAFAKQYTSQPKDASSDKSIINISSIVRHVVLSQTSIDRVFRSRNLGIEDNPTILRRKQVLSDSQNPPPWI